MPALIFLVIATAGENLFGFLSQLAYNSGILSKFACRISTPVKTRKSINKNYGKNLEMVWQKR